MRKKFQQHYPPPPPPHTHTHTLLLLPQPQLRLQSRIQTRLRDLQIRYKNSSGCQEEIRRKKMTCVTLVRVLWPKHRFAATRTGLANRFKWEPVITGKPVNRGSSSWLTSSSLSFTMCWLTLFLSCFVPLQIPDYRNAVIVARNPNSVKRATSYAERLRLSIAVIHGEERIPESEEDDGRNSPPIGDPEGRTTPSIGGLEILPSTVWVLLHFLKLSAKSLVFFMRENSFCLTPRWPNS